VTAAHRASVARDSPAELQAPASDDDRV